MVSGVSYFPIGLFTSVMGLCGLSIAYQRFEQVLGLQIFVILDGAEFYQDKLFCILVGIHIPHVRRNDCHHPGF